MTVLHHPSLPGMTLSLKLTGVSLLNSQVATGEQGSALSPGAAPSTRGEASQSRRDRLIAVVSFPHEGSWPPHSAYFTAPASIAI